MKTLNVIIPKSMAMGAVYQDLLDASTRFTAEQLYDFVYLILDEHQVDEYIVTIEDLHLPDDIQEPFNVFIVNTLDSESVSTLLGGVPTL